MKFNKAICLLSSCALTFAFNGFEGQDNTLVNGVPAEAPVAAPVEVPFNAPSKIPFNAPFNVPPNAPVNAPFNIPMNNYPHNFIPPAPIKNIPAKSLPPTPEDASASVEPSAPEVPADNNIPPTPEEVPVDNTIPPTPEEVPVDNTIPPTPEEVPVDNTIPPAPEEVPAENTIPPAPEEVPVVNTIPPTPENVLTNILPPPPAPGTYVFPNIPVNVNQEVDDSNTYAYVPNLPPPVIDVAASEAQSVEEVPIVAPGVNGINAVDAQIEAPELVDTTDAVVDEAEGKGGHAGIITVGAGLSAVAAAAGFFLYKKNKRPDGLLSIPSQTYYV